MLLFESCQRAWMMGPYRIFTLTWRHTMPNLASQLGVRSIAPLNGCARSLRKTGEKTSYLHSLLTAELPRVLRSLRWVQAFHSAHFKELLDPTLVACVTAQPHEVKYTAKWTIWEVQYLTAAAKGLGEIQHPLWKFTLKGYILKQNSPKMKEMMNCWLKIYEIPNIEVRYWT